ncbi:glycosyltransferase family 4 protein [bacterium]|nr:glycosyltransferase family 4 protein [bacterium]
MGRPLVIQLITRFIRGGAQLGVLLLAKNLPKFGYDVLVATGLEGELIGQAKKEGIPLYLIPSLKRDVSPFHDILALFQIISLLRKKKPAILHTHTSKAGFLGRIAGRICRVPVIVYSPRGHVFSGYFSPLKTKIFWLCEKLTLKMCDAFVCLTDEERREWIKYGFNHPRMSVIPSGVEIERFENPKISPLSLRKNLGIGEEEKVVGFIGRLAPVKGARYLLLAGEILTKRYPNFVLLFVGDGEEREELERMARERGIRALFLGNREDVEDFYHISDLVVVPSLNEAFGRVVVEAWSAGKAVVGSDVGGIRDLIDDGETGLLVPPANPFSLAEALEKLIKQESLARKLGDKGKEKAELYSVSAMMEKTVKLYNFLLKRKCGRLMYK